MHGFPASPPATAPEAEGLFGDELGLRGEVVEVDDDTEGDGDSDGVPTKALLSSCSEHPLHT
jgi:hypothetical protein